MVRLIEIHEFCKDSDVMIEKLQEWKLIPNKENYKCPQCENAMKLIKAQGRTDGWIWYCSAMIRKRKQAAVKCANRSLAPKGNIF